MRQHYGAGALRRADLAAEPFTQFAKWFQQARECPGIVEANAMTLATTGKGGAVTARTVLLKGWSEDGFVFFSNYASAKAAQIEENPQVCLLFPWVAQERQIIICGSVEKTSIEDSRAYFESRPLKSRIAASISPQSQIVSSREILEQGFEEAQNAFTDGKVPLPESWGGYRVVPQTIEFWQGRADRLHDRFLYTRESAASWRIERLAP